MAFAWFIWFVWFDQRNETDKIDQTDRPTDVLRSHGIRHILATLVSLEGGVAG